MKYLMPIVITIVLFQMVSALANNPTKVQFETSGVDKEYKHGHWCIDGRSF